MLDAFILFILALVLLAVLFGSRAHPDPANQFNPMAILAVIFGYYFVGGPIVFLLSERTGFGGTDYRDYFWVGELAALISYVFTWIGFKVTPTVPFVPRLRLDWDFSEGALWRAGALVFAVGVMLYTFALGFNFRAGFGVFGLNPEMMSVENRGGAFTNYFFFGISFLIPGLLLMLPLVLNKRLGRGLFYILAAVAVAAYLTTAFRYRLVLLAGSLTVMYYLMRNRRPALSTGFLAVAGLIITMGALGIARQYGHGLHLNQLQGTSFMDIVFNGFGDTGIMFGLCAVIKNVPDLTPYIGLDPLVQSVVLTIPRGLWENKPLPLTISTMSAALDYSGAESAGMFAPNFGEYYMMAGWIGVFLGSFAFGSVYKMVWLWFLANRDRNYARALYAVMGVFMFQIVHRGYLAQAVLNASFLLLPFVGVWWFRRALGASALVRAFNPFMRQRPQGPPPPSQPPMRGPVRRLPHHGRR